MAYRWVVRKHTSASLQAPWKKNKSSSNSNGDRHHRRSLLLSSHRARSIVRSPAVAYHRPKRALLDSVRSNTTTNNNNSHGPFVSRGLKTDSGTASVSRRRRRSSSMNAGNKRKTPMPPNNGRGNGDTDPEGSGGSRPPDDGECDDENRYRAELRDGFVTVEMMPPTTTIPASSDGRGPESSGNASVRDETDAPSSNADDGRNRSGGGGGDNENESAARDTKTMTTKTTTIVIPETVLRYERQLRKTRAAKRASTPLDPEKVEIVHDDPHLVVVCKPSGVLTVPGLNSNPSMLDLLHDRYRNDLNPPDLMKPEHMIVHRLDMDTSGIVVYAKSRKALLSLQAAFRDGTVGKTYEALVCGHLPAGIARGRIDLPLQRDHRFPPFMRVATPRSEREAKEVARDLRNAGWKKIVKKRPKPSRTLFEVLGREHRYGGGDGDDDDDRGYPVTRLRLTPLTGRTHQLRVHCAAIGHPILGDPAYGVYGEAAPNGGFDDGVMDAMAPDRASLDLQLTLDRCVRDANQVLCLHARELRVAHPETGEPLVVERPPAF